MDRDPSADDGDGDDDNLPSKRRTFRDDEEEAERGALLSPGSGVAAFVLRGAGGGLGEESGPDISVDTRACGVGSFAWAISAQWGCECEYLPQRLE